MSATIARSVNKIPSLVRFLILFLVFIALIHLFSLDIIQNINTNTDKSEVKASLKHPNANMEEKTSHRQVLVDRFPDGLRPKYDLIIVGSGLSGAVIAEQASERKGFKSLIIDKRDHWRKLLRLC